MLHTCFQSLLSRTTDWKREEPPELGWGGAAINMHLKDFDDGICQYVRWLGQDGETKAW